MPVAQQRAPQRRRGRVRVAALMRAAATVFAEKGFDAATMTEIAALAGAPIGSLYQFFPNKKVLADALLDRYGELIAAGLGEIEEVSAGLSATALADAVLDLIANLREETSAAFALLDAQSDWSSRRAELRRATRSHIARILAAREPQLPRALVDQMAVILLHNMRAMAALIAAQGDEAEAGAPIELREMTRLYLVNRLGPANPVDTVHRTGTVGLSAAEPGHCPTAETRTPPDHG
ncbi:MAG TPA: TetR/AcrR family transcriptional regulator [Stellaceae bacterium]|nr:TetR/AcrR family transcriptional regulator [Stellaceae bacterium]